MEMISMERFIIKNLQKKDRTYEFINEIEKKFHYNLENQEATIDGLGVAEVYKIQEKHLELKDINLIKPGIGETTRVLLRRVPWENIGFKRIHE